MTFIIRDIFQGMYAFGSLYISFRVCNSLLDELYTEKDPKKKIVLDEFDEMREYYNNTLLPLWKKLRIELEKYAVINLPT